MTRQRDGYAMKRDLNPDSRGFPTAPQPPYRLWESTGLLFYGYRRNFPMRQSSRGV